MYRFLIVDDEPGIVDGLYYLFKQNESFELDICRAYSGVEALSYLESTRIDIVMTDICMPGLDGMQLLDEISSKWPSCKVIFLTGHSEFEYVYKAIKKADVNYILKTEEDEVIFESVRNAVKKIDEENAIQDIIEKNSKRFKQALPMLRREFLMALLQGDKLSGDDMSSTFEELEMGIDASQPVLMLVTKINAQNHKTSYSERIQEIYIIQDIFEKYLDCMVSSIPVYTDNSIIVWFVQPESGISENREDSKDRSYMSIRTFIKGNIELIQNSVKDILNVSTIFAIANEAVLWEDVYGKFCSLKALINGSVLKDQQMLIIDESSEKMYSWQKKANYLTDHIYIERQMELLRKLLDNGLEEDFNMAFDGLMESIKRRNGSDSLTGVETYHTLSSMFISYINKMDLDTDVFADINIEVIKGLTPGMTWDEIISNFKKLSSIIIKSGKIREDDGVNKVIARIHRYISENIDKDISMARLSEVVHFNPSYLSRFYKQATGGTISDYINEVKLKMARELLVDKHLKINEVAERVGFVSPSYFSSFFKKMMKLSPQEYRDSI